MSPANGAGEAMLNLESLTHMVVRITRSVIASATLLALGASPDSLGQTPVDEALMAHQLQINGSRLQRLKSLLPRLMPDCAVRATDGEVDAFFVYWRQFIKDEIAWRRSVGIAVDDPKDLQPRQIGPIILAGQVSFAEMLNVSKATSGAEEMARTEIETWKAFHCVTARFGGTEYFASVETVSADGHQWPTQPPMTFGHDPQRVEGIPLPNMGVLEPLEALGRFFRMAQSQGLFPFFNVGDERYFFARYETNYFANMKEPEKASKWFDHPPWEPAPTQSGQTK